MSDVLADISKILLVVGLIFAILKILNKTKKDKPTFYEKAKVPLYNLHKVGSILATILAFIHGFTFTPIDPKYILSGWILGLSMVVLSILGIYLGFKSNWKPFDEVQNREFKNLRIIKWILTIIIIVFLAVHYIY
jgi:uncharacterized membrane protein